MCLEGACPLLSCRSVVESLASYMKESYRESEEERARRQQAVRSEK